MAKDVTYQPPSKEDWVAIATNPDLVSALTVTAERGKVHAEALSAEFTKTGHYEESFELQHEVQTYHKRGRARTRAAVLLVNTAEYAAALEDGWGSVDRPPAHHVLARVKALLEGAE